MTTTLLEPTVGNAAEPVPNRKDFPTDDGMPMESFTHVLNLHLLIDILATNWQGRRYFAAGNNFVHYSAEQLKSKEFLGPDFFVVMDVDPEKHREHWYKWEEEGKMPCFILEMLSESTMNNDLERKKAIYAAEFKTQDYLCYDFEMDALLAWTLIDGVYVPKRPKGDRVWCPSLRLWVGRWTGKYNSGATQVYLRFFDSDGTMLPTRGEKEKANADAEKRKTDTEKKRADTAESELAKVRELLAKLQSGTTHTNGG